ncbi:DUF5008 domain-containing protein [Pedobacter foliorum]|uniref:DUF5008 domain-containing protein n=1 Tax=Pedobacter foliorum TaxID=2739058 RepID=UPI001566C13F|nr:DUF5008 domain-containing protein [Pedobacter foliorum]NRF41706.1 DUF5008 domain-containing protein [Pedobacter foliorum]
MKSNLKVLIFALTIFIIGGCKKSKEVFDPPYQHGKPALGIKINETQKPVPEEGEPGTVVTILATGLEQYKDKLVFMFNGEKADVTEITETSISVKVPKTASSGVTSILIGGNIVFGPDFKVKGLINFDPTFRVVNGTNGPVAAALKLDEGKYYFVGGFTNYDNKGTAVPINRLVRTSLDGDIDRTLRVGTASNGYLSNMLAVGNQFIIAGGFSGYNQRKENISNITRLNTNGTIDTVGIKVFNPPTKPETIKFFPRFNGGTNGFISKIYNYQDKITATGDFRYYISRRYDKPNLYQTKDSVILDSTEIRQIVRLNPDGSLDKTYRFNAGTGKGLSGANGFVISYMHTKAGTNAGKMVLVGSFTTFDDAPVPYIIRLNADGTKDAGFNVGSGASSTISSVTYNETTGKYLITGTFKTFNGSPSNGIVMLNADGTEDKSFVAKTITEGYVYGAKQLSDGLIVVFGDFKKYGNVTRNGFMILNPNGELAEGYNATGLFNGSLNDVIETVSADSKRALLLIGQFNRFDNAPVQNIIRVTLE